jgi:hypothetical protein
MKTESECRRYLFNATVTHTNSHISDLSLASCGTVVSGCSVHISFRYGRVKQIVTLDDVVLFIVMINRLFTNQKM